VIGFEHLDVGGVVDTVGGQGGEPAAVADGAHRSSRTEHEGFAPLTARARATARG
jgi:hypothetical protein